MDQYFSYFQVRSIANSIIICFAFVIGFFVAKTFVDLTENIGYSGTFWLYGSICGLGAVCTAIFVPETRDKTFVQIQARANICIKRGRF